MLKNKSMYAILGILNISSSTGYDIKKYSDTVLSGFWNENFGHIYPTLKKMLKDGTIEIASGKKNERKILYKITEKGLEALNMWLLEETEQQPIRSEFMLKLLFSSNEPTEITITMLEKYKETYVKNVERYIKIQSDLNSGIQEISKDRTCFINAILRRGIISGEAVIRWCEETIELLKNIES